MTATQEFKPSGTLLEQGAEGRVFKSTFKNQICVIKHRFPKKYRHPILDKRLRKSRTKSEVKNIKKAQQLGILTPNILKCDEKNGAIYLQYIDAPNIKTILNDNFNKKQLNYQNTKINST